jgi:thiol-disulfide isomerase/thioredoxin
MSRKASVISLFVIVALAAIPGIARLRLTPAAQGGQPSSTLAAGASALRLAPEIEIVMYQGQTEVGGEKIALSALWEKKHQPVVLNFWAGLCPPCRAEMPDFQRLFEQPRRKFALIGVDIGPFIGLGSRDDGKALLRALKLTYPAGTTFDIRTIRNYEVLGMPTTVFITADGRILRKYTGLLTFEQMKTFTDELVRAASTSR